MSEYFRKNLENTWEIRWKVEFVPSKVARSRVKLYQKVKEPQFDFCWNKIYVNFFQNFRFSELFSRCLTVWSPRDFIIRFNITNICGWSTLQDQEKFKTSTSGTEWIVWKPSKRKAQRVIPPKTRQVINSIFYQNGAKKVDWLLT